MSNETPSNDPLDFMKGMWGNMGFSLPGMVAPTFDTEELEKRISDLKAVEGWLRMNLSMLQMTIQGLEMQHSTLTAVKAMGQMAAEARAPGEEGEAAGNGAFAQAAMWPWAMMQQMQS
ncbi:MAG TPA: PhaM family polyhydroxyalkanoate granule multifunctional regulatory protein, partial [Azospira sp.]|nr:PhaM family polyhydroxyalkanoate granule multifunctional regulatory protein [Azospira sp.]